MTEEKKRQGRRDHLNDFYRDVSGNYVYTGVCYEHTGGVCANTALLRRLWLMAAVMAAAVVTGGCISAPGVGRCFYVLLPYAAQIGVTGSIVWAVARWQTREYPLRAYVYRATVQALPGRCLAQAVLAGVGLAAETLYLLPVAVVGTILLLSGSGGHGAAAAVYLLLQACVLVLALLARRTVLNSDWQPEGCGGLTTE